MQELYKTKRELNCEKKNTPHKQWVPRETATMVSEQTAVPAHGIHTDDSTSEASPLCILSPGVYNGLNHYIHYTPFTWKLHFGLSAVKNTNWVFIVKKKPHRGESAVMVGKCLHFFFFFRNNAFRQFYLVFKTGSPGVYTCARRCVV